MTYNICLLKCDSAHKSYSGYFLEGSQQFVSGFKKEAHFAVKIDFVLVILEQSSANELFIPLLLLRFNSCYHSRYTLVRSMQTHSMQFWENSDIKVYFRCAKYFTYYPLMWCVISRELFVTAVTSKISTATGWDYLATVTNTCGWTCWSSILSSNKLFATFAAFVALVTSIKGLQE